MANNVASVNLQKALFIGVCVVLFITVYQLTNTPETKQDASCYVIDRHCSILLKQGTIEIDFPQTLVVEEMLQVNFLLPPTLSIAQLHIEGVNMNMGMLPVHRNSADQGEFFLGSCQLEQMQWRMVLQLTTVNDKKHDTLISPEHPQTSTNSTFNVFVYFTTQGYN